MKLSIYSLRTIDSPPDLVRLHVSSGIHTADSALPTCPTTEVDYSTRPVTLDIDPATGFDITATTNTGNGLPFGRCVIHADALATLSGSLMLPLLNHHGKAVGIVQAELSEGCKPCAETQIKATSFQTPVALSQTSVRTSTCSCASVPKPCQPEPVCAPCQPEPVCEPCQPEPVCAPCQPEPVCEPCQPEPVCEPCKPEPVCAPVCEPPCVTSVEVSVPVEITVEVRNPLDDSQIRSHSSLLAGVGTNCLCARDQRGTICDCELSQSKLSTLRNLAVESSCVACAWHRSLWHRSVLRRLALDCTALYSLWEHRVAFHNTSQRSNLRVLAILAHASAGRVIGHIKDTPDSTYGERRQRALSRSLDRQIKALQQLGPLPSRLPGEAWALVESPHAAGDDYDDSTLVFSGESHPMSDPAIAYVFSPALNRMIERPFDKPAPRPLYDYGDWDTRNHEHDAEMESRLQREDTGNALIDEDVVFPSSDWTLRAVPARAVPSTFRRLLSTSMHALPLHRAASAARHLLLWQRRAVLRELAFTCADLVTAGVGYLRHRYVPLEVEVEILAPVEVPAIKGPHEVLAIKGPHEVLAIEGPDPVLELAAPAPVPAITMTGQHEEKEVQVSRPIAGLIENDEILQLPAPPTHPLLETPEILALPQPPTESPSFRLLTTSEGSATPTPRPSPVTMADADLETQRAVAMMNSLAAHEAFSAGMAEIQRPVPWHLDKLRELARDSRTQLVVIQNRRAQRHSMERRLSAAFAQMRLELQQARALASPPSPGEIESPLSSPGPIESPTLSGEPLAQYSPVRPERPPPVSTPLMRAPSSALVRAEKFPVQAPSATPHTVSTTVSELA